MMVNLAKRGWDVAFKLFKDIFFCKKKLKFRFSVNADVRKPCDVSWWSRARTFSRKEDNDRVLECLVTSHISGTASRQLDLKVKAR